MGSMRFSGRKPSMAWSVIVNRWASCISDSVLGIKMRRLVLTTIFLCCVNQLSQIALACDCHWSENRFEEAKAVIYGQLLSIKRDHDKKVVIIKLRVQRVFKGNSSEMVMLYSDYVCSYNFRVGQRYLIYAGQRENGEWETGPCRILYEKLAKEEMKYLERGEKPRTKLGVSTPPNTQTASRTLLYLSVIM